MICKYRCSECSAKDEYEIKEHVLKYEKENEYSFSLNVKLPFCTKCGARLKDAKLDKELRMIAHQMIKLSQKATYISN